MPAQMGLFDTFDNLDQLDIVNIIRWLKPVPQQVQLENYLASRILYPQTLPLTEADMKIDLAILRESLRMNGPQVNQKTNTMLGDNPFLNLTLRKILIPQRFLMFVPNLVSLIWAFVDGLLLDRRKKDWFQDIWTVILTDDIDETVGSIILPQFSSKGALLELNIGGKTYKIKAGSLTVIPCPQDRCEISFRVKAGKILGKEDSAVEVYGGRLGLMIDGRII